MREYIYATDEHEGHWLTGEEIVRCRDCAYFNGWACEQSACTYCSEMHRTEPDGYCAWASRKEVDE